MEVLLVEPDYYTRFPPIGLLKIASYHRLRGDDAKLVRGNKKLAVAPSRIYVTSLFTYAWQPVHNAVKYYKSVYPDAKLLLGGIYASLMPKHAMLSGADQIYEGLFDEAEDLMPAYDLVPEWNASILFSSRGCLRNCGFCAVPKLESKPQRLKYSVKDFIYENHSRVIFWDNNILANDNWTAVFDEIIELKLKVDFNQGLDARFITDASAERLSRMKMDFVRLAYDTNSVWPSVKRAINLLDKYGISKKKIIVYALFNYEDNAEDFFERVKNILNLGAASYPMRFEPLDSLTKNQYVSKNWTKTQIDSVQRARRVLGFGGAFPPYDGLVAKFNKARCFTDAFSLRPILKESGSEDKGAINKKKARWIKERDWRNVGARKTI